MRSVVLFALLMIACNGSLAPKEGRWSFNPGRELARTCSGTQSAWALETEYALTNTDDDTFVLSRPGETDPLHTCTRDGDDFECPPEFVVGACFESTEIGFSGTFEGRTRAAGSIHFVFRCAGPPTGDGTGGGTTDGTGTGGGTTGDTEGDPDACCADFGDINPCTLTLALDAAWTSQ